MGERVYKYLKRLNLWREEEVFSQYDELEDAGDNGSLEKGYVRCKGKLLKELFDNVKYDPNCSYITCVNDLIKNSTFEEFAEHDIPMIVKGVRCGNRDYMDAELICSRLANIFGLDTAFYTQVDDGSGYVMSVDFLSALEPFSKDSKELRSQKIETFNEFTRTQFVHSKMPISSWMVALDGVLSKKGEFKGIDLADIDKLRKDFIKNILFRRFIIEDSDLNGGNIVFLHSKDYSDLVVGPNFDYELSLDNSGLFGSITATQMNDLRACDMTYLIRNFKAETIDILKSFTCALDKRAQIGEVFLQYTKNKDTAESWTSRICKNLKKLLEQMEKTITELKFEGGLEYEV